MNLSSNIQPQLIHPFSTKVFFHPQITLLVIQSTESISSFKPLTVKADDRPMEVVLIKISISSFKFLKDSNRILADTSNHLTSYLQNIA